MSEVQIGLPTLVTAAGVSVKMKLSNYQTCEWYYEWFDHVLHSKRNSVLSAMSVSWICRFHPFSMMSIMIFNRKKGNLSIIFLYGCHATQKKVKDAVISIRFAIIWKQIEIIVWHIFRLFGSVTTKFIDGFMRGRTITPNVSYHSLSSFDYIIS